MLQGMNAATSRHMVSSPMAHLIISFDGSRFEYSHEFVNLLVTQLDATLDGLLVDAQIRKKSKTGETVLWVNSSADDYIHRPSSDKFEALPPYQYFSLYKKCLKH